MAEPTVLLEDAGAIQAMRGKLEEMREHVRILARPSYDWASRTPVKVRPEYIPMNLGRVVEALDAAEYALFNVLNAAAAFGGCTECDRVLAASSAARLKQVTA